MPLLQGLILLNFFLLLVSLGASLLSVYKERGQGNRSLYLLSLRAFLAMTLLSLLGYGVASGQLGSRAPWDAFPAPSQTIK